MSVDPNFVELTADVLEIFFTKKITVATTSTRRRPFGDLDRFKQGLGSIFT